MEEDVYLQGPPPIVFRWDVFLSFRGEDTRHGFTMNLFDELVRENIRTFMDDDGLQRGEEIAPSLLTAIEDSSASIVVISKKYASSRWCLEELAKIVECRRTILPVFYEVDPSDVRQQKGPFKDDFEKLEKRFGVEKVLIWREAMTKAGGTAGWDSRTWNDESELIQALVKKISTVSSNTPLGVAKYPVGISSRVEEVMRVLDVKSNDVRVLGLIGMGGIGKTTLAKAVYNKMVSQFKHHSFIFNVREASRGGCNLVSLQKKLLRDLFPTDAPPVDDISKGINIIKQRIHGRPVLVVLDDVDDARVLEALVGGRDWFCDGSRIIITTRDRQVLEDIANVFYDVKVLSGTEPLQLFSYHAFGREKTPETFMSFSKEIASLTGGLPLALEVFGSLLLGNKVKKYWEDALEKLRKIPPYEIKELLKISYDALDEECKRIFLDIACFFCSMDMSRENAIDILKGCGFHAETAITELEKKSLIRIIDGNTLWMHDQIRGMGQNIVQQECVEDPGKRSRLWDQDEVMSVLDIANKGTRKIEGIILDTGEKKIKRILSSEGYSKIINRGRPISWLKEKFKNTFSFEAEEKEVKLRTDSFEPMINLRLLQINHANMEGSFKLIPSELRWLEWKGCPLDAFPSDFSTPKLSVLDLSESKIRHVWKSRWMGGQYKMAKKLKVMNLYGCYNLIATPDFVWHPNLEKLILERCTELIYVHKSIGDLSMLRILNLKDCRNLMEFPTDVSGLRKLEKLILSGCSNLKELPTDLRSLTSLTELLVDGTAIEKLPDSISCLTKLETFSLRRCLSLTQLPTSIGKLVSLRELYLDGSSSFKEIPISIGSLKSLEKLNLAGCKLITILPDSIGNMESLLSLFLSSTSIRELPDSIGLLSHLKLLSLFHCESLSNLPNSIGRLISLSELHLDYTSIKGLPDEIGKLNMLENLEMRFCNSLRCLPDSIVNISSLTTLILNDVIITELPESIGQLEKLKILNINKCKRLRSLPSSIGNLKNLHTLLMEGTDITDLPRSFGNLSSLGVLRITKRLHLQKPQNIIAEYSEQTILTAQQNKFFVLPTSFSNLSFLYELNAHSCGLSGEIPNDFEKLSSLETLDIGRNNICRLPSSLRGLSLLRSLILSHCVELKSLPPLPSSLLHVNIANCTALESISDLSNLKNLAHLDLTNCNKVIDVPGLESLKSLKWLYMSGCTACCSVVKRRLSKVALRHIRNLSLPGSDIPHWFVQESLNFSSRRNRKIRNVIICVVISLDQQLQDDFREAEIVIPDVIASILREPGPRSIFNTALNLQGIPKTHEDQIYLCRYPDCNPLVSLLEDGDRIQVKMRDPPFIGGLQLKKYGTHLVFEDDDDYDYGDDDAEPSHESQLSVSEKLAKFFRSLE
ncbi:PREDICTED: TMV resistance protein N-like [Nelumbo nucifera]|uniref:TMV resistance protein N-like n=2 Tax=Nelumbo nucifera TaxID=4432 RepID=A0A1U7ZTU6_NELNU|nr:PREDICTED: TMV resistance protein N-like [Nelumbo nucifera]DAD43081.1 TPA_asm: hypothetical protein HUJ06_001311 [Nelumbo nucifera]